jgi:hypothetical protein
LQNEIKNNKTIFKTLTQSSMIENKVKPITMNKFAHTRKMEQCKWKSNAPTRMKKKNATM